MANKRFAKLPMSSGGPTFDVKFSDFDWAKLEQAYGRKLSMDMRIKVIEATQTHVLLTGFEKSAEPISPAIKRVYKLKSSAQEFRNEMFVNSKSDCRWFADHAIRRNYQDPRLKGRDLFYDLGAMLDSFIVACGLALQELEKAKLDGGPREGNGWNIWIFLLTSAARNFKLPHGVPTENGVVPPFVRLVIMLQDQIPAIFRRPYHSKDALAKAIQRARTAVKKGQEQV
jgi:hypothetical protein